MTYKDNLAMAEASITEGELAQLVRSTEDATSAYMRADMNRYLALTRHAAASR